MPEYISMVIEQDDSSICWFLRETKTFEQKKKNPTYKIGHAMLLD
jgi:hypothetical protein